MLLLLLLLMGRERGSTRVGVVAQHVAVEGEGEGEGECRCYIFKYTDIGRGGTEQRATPGEAALPCPAPQCGRQAVRVSAKRESFCCCRFLTQQPSARAYVTIIFFRRED